MTLKERFFNLLIVVAFFVFAYAVLSHAHAEEMPCRDLESANAAVDYMETVYGEKNPALHFKHADASGQTAARDLAAIASVEHKTRDADALVIEHVVLPNNEHFLVIQFGKDGRFCDIEQYDGAATMAIFEVLGSGDEI